MPRRPWTPSAATPTTPRTRCSISPRDAGDRVQHIAEDAYGFAGDKLGTVGHDVTELVKKYPIQALLVGFGVGLLMGRASRS